MNRARVSAAVLVAAALLSPAAPAHAAPDPTGALCGFLTVTDPVNGWQVGEIDGGPVALVDDADPSKVYWGSVTCTIQRDQQHGSADNDLASLTGSTTPGVAAVAGTVAFHTEPGDWLWLCTRVNIAGGPTLYYDGESGTWSESSAAQCSTSAGPSPEPFPSTAVDAIIAFAEAVVCPVLAVVFPPHGDVLGLWDCPPYDA